jgi:hypothetical protein
MLANLEVAGRLYIALCAQYPGRFITLFDENGVRVSAFNKSDVPVKNARHARDSRHYRRDRDGRASC